MNAFDRLHPALQHHIVNSLGWRRCVRCRRRPSSRFCAASTPFCWRRPPAARPRRPRSRSSRGCCSEDWQGLSVLYVCPIKALLNNLEPRLVHYAGLVGRSVALWHGDVGPARKAKIVADPPDILLTTPESLEVMLVSGRIDHRRLFAGLRCVIVDEVHAFAGDDRGWHLLYLLERLSHIAGRELQRLGLSATVGNPERSATGWPLVASGREPCDQPAGGCASRPRDVEVDWVGNLRQCRAGDLPAAPGREAAGLLRQPCAGRRTGNRPARPGCEHLSCRIAA